MPRRRPDFEPGEAGVKLNKLSDADGLKSGGCPTPAEPIFESRSVYKPFLSNEKGFFAMPILVAFFFSVFILLSVLREIPRFRLRMQKIPWLLHIVPTWGFFAPIPGRYDYHLMFRTMLKDGAVTDWQEVEALKDKRAFSHLIWNPDKKFLKSLVDLAGELLLSSRHANQESQIQLSMPYLHILNYVSSINLGKNTEKVQFMLLTSSRMSDYEMQFVSGFHRLHIKNLSQNS